MILKRLRVTRYAQKCWTRGFYSGVGGMGRQMGLLAEGPRWWQEVLDIAYDAGANYAALVIARRDSHPTFPQTRIPADVLAACLAAASR